MGILKIKDFKSAEMFLLNSIKEVEHRGSDAFIPENFKQISDELFSLDGVHVCNSPVVNDKPTRTERNLSNTSILQNIKSYLNKGAEVHMYQYYGLRQEVVGLPGITNTYWWRFIAIKNEE